MSLPCKQTGTYMSWLWVRVLLWVSGYTSQTVHMPGAFCILLLHPAQGFSAHSHVSAALHAAKRQVKQVLGAC